MAYSFVKKELTMGFKLFKLGKKIGVSEYRNSAQVKVETTKRKYMGKIEIMINKIIKK